MMPMMATTISSSMRVNPRLSLIMFNLLDVRRLTVDCPA
jgi:hypothetical protein